MKESSPLEAALKYREGGWSVFPVKPGIKKVPYVQWEPYMREPANEAEIRGWWQKWPEARIGLVTGKVSGVVVLDMDGEKGGEFLKGKELPPTCCVRTARGKHLYFKYPDFYVHNYVKVNGLDIRGDRGYVMLPPSSHHTGRAYEWTISPEEKDPAEMPGWLVDFMKKLERNRGPDPDSLEQFLAKYWEKEGQRHQIALGVAGYLCKLNWPWAVARHLVQTIGKMVKDEEMNDRLRALKDTYEKWQKGHPVAGYEKLRDILTVTDLETFEQLARDRGVPTEVRMIDNIRRQPRHGSNGKPQFIVDREMCNAIVTDLKEQGRFFQVDKSRWYWFDSAEKRVTTIDSQMMGTIIDRRYGINPAEKLMKNVLASLRSETLTNGEEVKVYQLAHYEPGDNVLYVYAGEGLVYKLNGKEIVTQDNGKDGVFFEEMEKEACWRADFDHATDPFEVLIKDLSFASGEGVVLAPDYQRMVFWLWLRSLFFEEIQPTKPILVLTGDHGSGKSTALRRVLLLLFGPKGEVSTMNDDRAWTPAITSNYLLVIDNVDKRLKWLPEKLNLAATGQTISVRVLYETNQEYRVRPRCFLALTTVRPPFPESTVVDRFILLRMRPLEKYVSEKRMKRNILDQRNQLWSGILKQLNSDINYLRGKDIDVTFRMADWAELCGKLLRQEKNGGEIFNTIINGLKQEQSAQVLDHSIIPQILDKWQHIGSEWYSVAELYERWKDVAENNNLGFFKSAKGLAMHLGNIRRALHAVYGLECRSNGRIWKYQFPQAAEGERIPLVDTENPGEWLDREEDSL